jgi:hypothetical protein
MVLKQAAGAIMRDDTAVITETLGADWTREMETVWARVVGELTGMSG